MKKIDEIKNEIIGIKSSVSTVRNILHKGLSSTVAMGELTNIENYIENLEYLLNFRCKTCGQKLKKGV